MNSWFLKKNLVSLKPYPKGYEKWGIWQQENAPWLAWLLLIYCFICQDLFVCFKGLLLIYSPLISACKCPNRQSDSLNWRYFGINYANWKSGSPRWADNAGRSFFRIRNPEQLSGVTHTLSFADPCERDNKLLLKIQQGPILILFQNIICVNLNLLTRNKVWMTKEIN